MSKLIFMFIISFSYCFAGACYDSRIKAYTNLINASSSDAAVKLALAVDALSSCKDRGFAVGLNLGLSFNSSYSTTYPMSKVIIDRIDDLNTDIAKGLVSGLIVRIHLDQTQSHYLIFLIHELGKNWPAIAAEAAENLLIIQNPSYSLNNYLLEAVTHLNQFANNYQNDESEVGSDMDSYWTFKDIQIDCDRRSSRRDRCYQSTASTVDEFGNKILLTCQTQKREIRLDLYLTKNTWNTMNGYELKMFGIGTRSGVQNLGQPRIDSELRHLSSYEPVSYDVLNDLRRMSSTTIKFQYNDRYQSSLNIRLKGSNQAIQQLMSVCQ